MAMIFLNILLQHLLQKISPVPSDYILGPGDKLELNYFGSNIQTVESLYMQEMGKCFLPLDWSCKSSGMKFEEAVNIFK